MKYFFLLLLLLLVAGRLYAEFDPPVLYFMKWPLLESALLLGTFIIAGRQTSGYVVFALISDVIAGYAINSGTTIEEKTRFFFIGMALYFALHVNLLLYFKKINPNWWNDLRSKPIRWFIPGLFWITAYVFLTVCILSRPDLPGWAIGPIFIYSGIYVLLVAMAWNLDKVILDKNTFRQLMAGAVFLLVSDTLLGVVLFGQISGKSPAFPNMFSAVATWTLGIFLVFYSLIYIQKETPKKTLIN